MNSRRLTSAFIIALIVSGIFTFVLSQKFSKTKAAPPPPKTMYVAPTANLEAGQAIRPENLHLVEWPATSPIAGAFSAPDPLVGRVVLYPLAANQPILDRQVSAPGAGTGLTVKIPDGMRAIALRTDEVVGVAGFLLPGTHVDVLVTLHSTNTTDTITTTVLQDVEVLATGQKTEPDPEGKATTATVVTLLVKPEDAERVVLASTQGQVHFVLRNGADREAVTGPAVLLSQIAGTPQVQTPTLGLGKRILISLPKPYVVETMLGSKQRMDSF